MGRTKQLKESETEAKARVFVAENEPLLERATPATLHRMILQGSEIATALSEEVVREMGSHEKSIRELTAAINNPKTPAARIQKLEEKRMSLGGDKSANGQAMQEVFNELASPLDRAITLRQEREVLPEMPEPTESLPGFNKPDPKYQPKRGFWSRLFGR